MGGVYTLATGHYFVIQWNRYYMWASPASVVRFQVVLDYATNDIYFNYPTAADGVFLYPEGTRGAIGIEGDGSVGSEYYFWGDRRFNRPVAGTTIRFSSQPVANVREEWRPTVFALEQNYPNPFNPSTAIAYDVAAPSDVRLAVYDILGREVSVLVNERKGPGNYSVKFDASDLASGVYVYRLQAGNVVRTRKMILLK